MRTLQGCIWKSIRVLAFFCSMLVVRSNVWAEPITLSHAIELSKNRAGLVASSVDGESLCRTQDIAKEPNISEASDQSNDTYSFLLKGVSGGANSEPGLQLELLKRGFRTCFRTLDASGAPHEEAINTALAYIRLIWATAHLSARGQQHELARRLVVVERMRVRAGVDDGVVLYRARLLEAQTRMRAASLEADVLELRQKLAAQIGLSEPSLEVVPDSVPALPTIYDYSGSEQTVAWYDEFELLRTQAKQLTAARDAAQLTYFLTHRDALRMRASTTATLGDQITSQIRDGENFSLLLSEIGGLQESEFALLVAIGGVEKWATGTAQLIPNSLVSEHRAEQGARQVPPAETQRHGVGLEIEESVQGMNAPLMKSVTPSSKMTIMVLPSDSTLTVRTCKQFAAVAIADGIGKDVTSVAKWSSSKESVAIVSTSGLITATGTGEAVIGAKLNGISRMVRITVVDAHD